MAKLDLVSVPILWLRWFVPGRAASDLSAMSYFGLMIRFGVVRNSLMPSRWRISELRLELSWDPWVDLSFIVSRDIFYSVWHLLVFWRKFLLNMTRSSGVMSGFVIPSYATWIPRATLLRLDSFVFLFMLILNLYSSSTAVYGPHVRVLENGSPVSEYCY